MAPLCPLVGVVGWLYFVVVTPMLRWLLVFTYRPAFDAGGDRWPYLHQMIMTSLYLGQFITSVTLLLKFNLVEGIIIGLCVIPTKIYNDYIKENFMPAFQDAALLQTSRLKRECHSCHNSSWTEREEYRRWLVDCHKASYVPTCLSGGTENLVTAEPCCVIASGSDGNGKDVDGEEEDEELRKLLKRQTTQRGGFLRRKQHDL